MYSRFIHRCAQTIVGGGVLRSKYATAGADGSGQWYVYDDVRREKVDCRSPYMAAVYWHQVTMFGMESEHRPGVE